MALPKSLLPSENEWKIYGTINFPSLNLNLYSQSNLIKIAKSLFPKSFPPFHILSMKHVNISTFLKQTKRPNKANSGLLLALTIFIFLERHLKSEHVTAGLYKFLGTSPLKDRKHFPIPGWSVDRHVPVRGRVFFYIFPKVKPRQFLQVKRSSMQMQIKISQLMSILGENSQKLQNWSEASLQVTG